MMDGHEGVPIRKLPTGVPGLDDVLGGGLPELSLNLVVGGPGSGKTTLAHQIMFANVTGSRGGLYFTIVGERPRQLLRYQKQYRLLDPAKGTGLRLCGSLSGPIKQDAHARL